MDQVEIYPQPTQPQNIYERWKAWLIRLFQREECPKVIPPTANTNTLTSEERPVFATEQEGGHATALPDTRTRGIHSRHQPGVRNVSHTHSPYPPPPPIINSFATQFQGAHDFSISGNPTFTNIGVNNGVNNVNTINNNGGVHVDNRGQRRYDINVGTQYGNTNIGDGQHNGGGIYNFKGIH